MFGRSIKLFTLFGFAVRLDASWLLIAALWMWSLAVGVFPAAFPGFTGGEYWWMAAAGSFGLFASIVLHELSHSLVARRHGLRMNGITLFLFGGVAELEGEPENPKTEFLMAIAGPVASIVIGVVFYFIAYAGNGSWPLPVVGVLTYLAWLNWFLAAFNLIPAFPLDGGRVLRSGIWSWTGDLRRATRIASAIGSGFGMILMAWGFYRLVVGDIISAFWYGLVGFFLRNVSQSAYEQVLVKLTLANEPVARIMHDPVTVPAGISIRDLVENYIYRYHYQMFPVVTDSDELVGCVTTRDVGEVARDEWSSRTVEDVAHRCSESETVTPDTDAWRVLDKMRRTGVGRLLVTEHGRLLAIVSMKDVMNFLAAKMDVEGVHGRRADALRP